MYIPSKGYLMGNPRNMKEPHLIGGVLWAKTFDGYHVPLDLHGKLTVNDEQGLQQIFELLMRTRKALGALQYMQSHAWDDFEIIEPWLKATIRRRAEVRELIAMGEWDSFWSSTD